MPTSITITNFELRNIYQTSLARNHESWVKLANVEDAMEIFISFPLGENPAQIETAWDMAGIEYQSHVVTAFSIGAADYAMLIINSDAAKLAVGALAGWIAAKQNRRVSLRIDGKDFSANNVKELEKVIELASKVDKLTPTLQPTTIAATPDAAASPHLLAPTPTSRL